MQLRRRGGFRVVALGGAVLTGLAFGLGAVGPESTVSASATPLLQQSDLIYEGGFRLPAGTFGGSSFDYGGSAMTFNPTNNSLYIVGHDHHQMIAEITVPTPVNSREVAALPTASVLQPFRDATEGLLNGRKIGGLMVHSGKLYGTAFVYYDGDAAETLSHFARPLSLATAAQVGGLYAFIAGPLVADRRVAGSVGGWMAPVPAEWQSALGGPALTGQCCVPIISRTSSGPAAFVFDPAHLGKSDPVPSQPLLHYPLEFPLADPYSPNDRYNLSTAIGGMVFPAGSRTVLYFGRVGLGEYCYGDTCYDPESPGIQGIHMYPYQYNVWAYDVLDLVAVKQGSKKPWEVKPYATWALTFPTAASVTTIGAAAYDPATQRLWITQDRADGATPLVHAFTVRSGSEAAGPPPPPNVRIVSGL